MRDSFFAILSVAGKEFLHLWRDRRILVLIVVLPPLLTLIFGQAFEVSSLSHIPALLQDRDQSAASRAFVKAVSEGSTFDWQVEPPATNTEPDLLRRKVEASLTIPAGWGESLKSGQPAALRLLVDGSDTTTADQVSGYLQATLAQFQIQAREQLIDQLPGQLGELANQIPLEVRRQFTSASTPWQIDTRILYNPKQRFIDYITPGIIGLILQLLTVTLMACTIAREREAGTLYQMLITTLRRGEIVIGKVLPYLVVSMFLILTTVSVAFFYFDVHFHRPLLLAFICLLFLLCSLGMGLLISAFSSTQTQAIQFAVFYLLPVFPLSGAFAPLEQLPANIRALSQTFPLTHFCRAFRMVSLRDAPVSLIAGDLTFLLAGAILTCAGAAYLLQRIED